MTKQDYIDDSVAIIEREVKELYKTFNDNPILKESLRDRVAVIEQASQIIKEQTRY